MPRSVGIAPENNFKQGFITEATGLNFPENACVETSNCVHELLGTVSRRLGIDKETAGTNKTIDRTGGVINNYLWKNVTGDGTVNFVVVQVGSTVYFYNTGTVESLSLGANAGSITLSTYSPSGATSPKLNDCQFSDGLGKLFIVHPFMEPVYVTYDASGNTFTTTQITISIRDFEGNDDGLAIDNRPTATLAGLAVKHKYNLFNQGWSTTDLTTWDTAFTTMPSNVDVPWTFKNSSDAFDPATTINHVYRGNTTAPKGHYILNVSTGDRDTASGLSGTTATASGTARPSTTCFAQGRVWYSGIKFKGFESNLYFSQIIERDSQVGSCYQANDPTSEDLFDLAPNDGGVIKLPEAGNIYKLWSLGSSVLVFAYRGIWLIAGNNGQGFTADDYAVTKISSYRVTSSSSFVDVNGMPVWWTQDGIFSFEGSVSQPQVVSLTYSTIQSWYDEIPNSNKSFARGVFNPLDFTVVWVYRNAESGSLQESYEFDSALVFNTQTKAFYPWSFGESTTKIHGVVNVDGSGGTTVEVTVVNASAVTVVDGSSATVITNQLTQSNVVPRMKFLISTPSGATWNFTFAELKDETYVDWRTYSSVAYDSYFITGYKTHGDAMRKFQTNYVNIFNNGEGACTLQGLWDYSTSGNTGRFSSVQNCTFDGVDYSNQHVRRKIRGHGLTCQYKVMSVTGEPFHLIGWSTLESANASP